jgi:hypothetical protein
VAISLSKGIGCGPFAGLKGLLLGALYFTALVPQTGYAQEDWDARRDNGVSFSSLKDSKSLNTETPMIGPNFVYLKNATTSIACGPRKLAGDSLFTQITRAEKALGIDVQIAIILVTQPIGCGNLFYIPIANDITGIGYAYTNGVEVFDDDPETALEGIAFLNDLPYWDRYRDEFRTAFLHEVGHRWGARVGAFRGGNELTLTGREGGHWSYFLDSEGSPLEGNRFERDWPNVTATPLLRLSYSPLDLYLMGLLAPSAVGTIRLLENGSAKERDCLGYEVTRASPPQTCRANELSGDWLELSIYDVIAEEGIRTPQFKDSSKNANVGFFILGNENESWSVSDCEFATEAIDDKIADFFTATGNRMRLTNVVGDGISCRDIVERTKATVPSPHHSCAISRRGKTESSFGVVLLVGFFFAMQMFPSLSKLRRSR